MSIGIVTGRTSKLKRMLLFFVLRVKAAPIEPIRLNANVPIVSVNANTRESSSSIDKKLLQMDKLERLEDHSIPNEQMS